MKTHIHYSLICKSMRGFFAALACFCLSDTGKAQTLGTGSVAGTFSTGTIFDLSGTGPVVMTAALTLTNTTNSTYSGSLSGPSSLTKTGSATLTLTGTSTFTNRFFVYGGTIALTGDAFLRINPPAGGNLAMLGSNYLNQDGALTLSGNSVYETDNGMQIGYVSSGRLEITDNAIVSTGAQAVYVGGDQNNGATNATGTGVLRINGNGGLIVDNNFGTGHFGLSDIEVMGSGSIIATNASAGQIIVRGTNSGNRFVVGGNAYVKAQRLYIGMTNIPYPMNSLRVLLQDEATMELTAVLGILSGTLEVTGNAKLISTHATNADEIGQSTTGTGWMVLSGSATWERASTGYIAVGRSENTSGVLEIRDAVTLETDAPVYIGGDYNLQNHTMGTGRVIIDGTAASWHTGTTRLPNPAGQFDMFVVGGYGTGFLEIKNGGKLINEALGEDTVIGYGSGTDRPNTEQAKYVISTGSASVSGSNSEWSQAGRFIVGNNGNGVLEIKDGGMVVSQTTVAMGYGATSSGTVSISGSNSLWNMTGTGASYFNLGNSGNGYLEIKDGGVLITSSTVNFAGGAAGSGTMSISGDNSLWTASGTGLVTIGNLGSGYLEIGGGGKVMVEPTLRIGFGNQNGTGRGTVKILTGGTLETSGSTLIGGDINNNINASGTVQLDGVGATWKAENVVSVGYTGTAGTGFLGVSNGALATMENTLYIAHAANNTKGEVVVSGSGARLEVSGSLIVGERGQGVLRVEKGGTVVSGTVFLSNYNGATSTGTVVLTGNATEGRGVLETVVVMKNLVNNQNAGPATLIVDGGVLRAKEANGDAIIDDASVTFTMLGGGLFYDSNGFDITFNRRFSGEGGIGKLGEGSLTLDPLNETGLSANTYTGVTSVHGGTLVLPRATVVANSTTMETGGDGVLMLGWGGTLDKVFTGSGGSVVLAHDSALTGNNSGFSGRWAVVSSTVTAAGIGNLGTESTLDLVDSGARVELAQAGEAGSGNFSLANALKGEGRLVVATLASAADEFSLAPSAGTEFRGVLELGPSVFSLEGDNVTALAGATLQLNAGNTTTVGTGTQKFKGLTINGSELVFNNADATAGTVLEMIEVETLTLDSGTIKINVDTSSGDVIMDKPLLDQDDDLGIKIITGNVINTRPVDLVDASGTPVASVSSRIETNGETTAMGIYGYNATSGRMNDGLYIGYNLKSIDLLADKTTRVEETVGYGEDSDSATLNSYFTGSGHLELYAVKTLTLNGASSYTGSTTVVGGTVVTTANNAFGETSVLHVSSSAVIKMDGYAQVARTLNNRGAISLENAQLRLRNGGVSTGTLAGSNGTLVVEAGAFSVTGANPALSSLATTVADGATVMLDHLAGLGNGGAVTVAGTLLLGTDASAPPAPAPAAAPSSSAAANGAPAAVDFAGGAPGARPGALGAVAGGEWTNRLSGNGLVVMHGAGDIIFTATSGAFTGTLRQEGGGGGEGGSGGRFIARNADALGAGTVEATGVVDYSNISSGTLAARLTGADGVFVAKNSAFTVISGNNTIGRMEAENSNLVLASAGGAIGTTSLRNTVLTLTHPNALGVGGTVTASEGSRIIVGVDKAQLGAVELHNSTLEVASSGSGVNFVPREVSVAGLSGEGSTLVINADFGRMGIRNDLITLTGDNEGTHSIKVNHTGAIFDPNGELSFIETTTGVSNAAVFELEGGSMDVGEGAYGLQKGDGSENYPDSQKWYLAPVGLSNAADAILDTIVMAGIDWNYSLDSLYQRMGDIHTHGARAGGHGNAWLRARGHRLEATNRLSGRSFKQDNYGVTAGLDIGIRAAGSVFLAGGMVDSGNIDRNFVNQGTGKTSTWAMGLYGTWVHDKGWFADVVFKLDYYDNEFEARDFVGHSKFGKFKNEAQGGGIELGRVFRYGDGTWVEFSAQAALARIKGADYETTSSVADEDPIVVRMEDATAAQYRVQVRFGRALANSKWNPYVKFAGVRGVSSGGVVHATVGDKKDKPLEPDIAGWRAELGAGVSYFITPRNQLYLDYEYAKALSYSRPWSVGAGYRLAW